MITDWVPLLVAGVSIAGAIATYAYQRRADRRSALVEMRRAAYRSYLSSFTAMTNSPERVEEVSLKLYQSEIELLIVGSDEVIQKVGALSQYYARTNDDRFNRNGAEVRRLVAEICRAMRTDCFEQSDLSVDEIKALVPIA